MEEHTFWLKSIARLIPIEIGILSVGVTHFFFSGGVVGFFLAFSRLIERIEISRLAGLLYTAA